MAGPTLTVRGSGGHVFEKDVPAEGTEQRRLFDRAVAKGQLVVLEGDWPQPEAGPADPKPAPRRTTPKGDA